MFTKKLKTYEYEFEIILADILNNDTVLKMKQYVQHYDTNCYDHCYNVAIITYNICKLLHLNYIEATRAAMLHDLFLYNWRIKSNNRRRFHAFHHPSTALKIASQEFNLTAKEQDIILKHMWPLTIVPPKSLEGFCVTLADKLSAIYESFLYYKKIAIFRYSYILWAMLLFKI